MAGRAERAGAAPPSSSRHDTSATADDNMSIAGEEDPGAALDTSDLTRAVRCGTDP